MRPIPTPAIPRSVLLDALAGADICFTCRGSGKIQVSSKDRHGLTCSMCHGRGVKARS